MASSPAIPNTAPGASSDESNTTFEMLFAPERDRRPLIIHKPVNSRKNRPSWARDNKSMMRHLLGKGVVRRLRIAYLYWQANWTAKQIADEIGLTVGAIQKAIQRMNGT